MTGVEMLREVKQLIGTPETWCQGQDAKDKDGHRVPENSDMACSWCLTGALSHVNRNYECHEYLDAYQAVVDVIGNTTPYYKLVRFNDGQFTQHKDVMRVIDLSIVEMQDRLYWKELKSQRAEARKSA